MQLVSIHLQLSISVFAQSIVQSEQVRQQDCGTEAEWAENFWRILSRILDHVRETHHKLPYLTLNNRNSEESRTSIDSNPS